MTKRLMHPIRKTERLLGVKRSTVSSLLRSGELVRVKVGRKTLVLDSSIHEFIERHKA